MRFPEKWLRDWIDPEVDSATLAQQLTLLGLEVDSAELAAPPFSGVVVGRVTEVQPHPEADRLRVCTVEDGSGKASQVVCGAPNVVPGLVAPFARVAARLPDGTKIRKAKLRGIESQGMLCSARELGLGDDADGLMELPADAPVGKDFRKWGDLDDTIIEIDLTPNRGDCLSIRGIARELAVANGLEFLAPDIPAVPAETDETLPVSLDVPADCPRYAGRIIRGINPQARTPAVIRNRLLAAGVRPLHPVVDVTNYVMLELGQPMHAFDLSRLGGGIRVRMADGAESIELLDGRTVTPDSETMVIADDSGPVAVAGIMGGNKSAVDDETVDIFLESACFLPHAMAGRARRLAAHSDSSHRFERGVDPELAPVALERATQLILDICEGTAAEASDTVEPDRLPERATIQLRQGRVERLLGYAPAGDRIEAILTGLGVTLAGESGGWIATAPSWRFDLAIEPDLIEEIARVEGYNRAPRTHPAHAVRMNPVPEERQSLDRVRDLLVERGYHEAVTYSFVDERIRQKLDPDVSGLTLENPIASDMGVMRTSLWPGLVQALLHNRNRQQSTIRLFEAGLRFRPDDNGDLRQEMMIAGLLDGQQEPDHWAGDGRVLDFFDIKGDLEALLATTGDGRFRFAAEGHPALHPGQCARVLHGSEAVGWIGMLHPGIAEALDLSATPFLFELKAESLTGATLPAYRKVSRFPSIRRDLALIVGENTPIQDILDGVRASAPEELVDVFVFDVYQGKGIDSGRKSVALGLILQGLSRTLTDQDVEAATTRILEHLEKDVGATLRG